MYTKLFLSFIHDLVKGSMELDSPALKRVKELSKNESNFLMEIKNVLEFFSKSINKEKASSDILEAFVEFLELELIAKLDLLSLSFFISGISEKVTILNSIIETETLRGKIIYRFLFNESYEEIQSTLKIIIRHVYPEKGFVIVQSAYEIGAEMKREVRNEFKNDVVTFQVNRDLLGGMKVYKNGRVVDTSWLGKIIALQNFNPLNNE